MILGAIIGDIIGSRFEGKEPEDRMKAPLFTNKNKFTDDSVMTIAVAKALIDKHTGNDTEIIENLTNTIRLFARKYPDAGYGSQFKKWFSGNDTKPYGSIGNGSAMRVSSIGWMCKSLNSVFQLARMTADITHNSEDGENGAIAIASVCWMARNNIPKEQIMLYVQTTFGYDLSDNAKNVGKSHTCSGTVPAAIWCYLNGNNFEEIIRLAISLGGDTDTIAAMAGSMAEAHYAIPSYMKDTAYNYLGSKLGAIVKEIEDQSIDLLNCI